MVNLRGGTSGPAEGEANFQANVLSIGLLHCLVEGSETRQLLVGLNGFARKAAQHFSYNRVAESVKPWLRGSV
jgi:hypothetical protein